MTSSFGNLFDKLKSSTKSAAGQMKTAGRIAALRVERSTQKAERERLLKEIGSKTFSIFSKTQGLDLKTLEEEITNELRHIERIDKRLEEVNVEIETLKAELLPSAAKDAADSSKDVVDAADVQEAGKGEDDSHENGEKK
jgi:hypothetical protein